MPSAGGFDTELLIQVRHEGISRWTKDGQGEIGSTSIPDGIRWGDGMTDESTILRAGIDDHDLD